jgi:hypothetical protein
MPPTVVGNRRADVVAPAAVQERLRGSGGTGKFTWFSATVGVSPPTTEDPENWHWAFPHPSHGAGNLPSITSMAFASREW